MLRMIYLRMAFVLSIALAATPAAIGQSFETGFLNRSFNLEGVEYRYQVFVPRQYKPSVQWPVVLALHGAGERGTDGLIQTEVGLGRAIRRHAERFPAIVVFPQVPQGTTPGWQALGTRLASNDHSQDGSGRVGRSTAVACVAMFTLGGDHTRIRAG